MPALSSSEALPLFKEANLLVLGDIMLDRYWLGSTSRVSPEAPVPIVHVQENTERPGGAANVACNVHALGARVTLLGVIGFDEAGESLLALLRTATIQTDLYQSSQLSTIVKLRVLSKHQQLLRMDFEKTYLDAAIEAELLQRFKRALRSAHLVILSDYLKGTLLHPDVFIRAALEAKVPVLVDPKSYDASLYRGATWLTPNLKEFETMVGPCPDEATMVQKARSLLAAQEIQALL
ncbi:MAG TPA: PfkB family carbohydrate kinase, partial [Myxococcota bacterium]|nr:PfkB family carbohydrate kinase [Myxococcota bacterium]